MIGIKNKQKNLNGKTNSDPYSIAKVDDNATVSHQLGKFADAINKTIK